MLEISSIGLLLGGLTLVLIRIFRNRTKFRLPPGPKGVPMIGSFFEIPSDHYWLKFDEWVQKFGPICSFTTFGKTVIIVGSPKVAADLLDRRSAIYSGRPRWVFASEMLARNMHVGTINAGEKFRRAIHAGLHPKAITSYHSIEEREARAFLHDVSRSPEDFRNSIKRYTAAVILGTMYGHQVTTFDGDRFAKRVFKSASRFAGSLAPGAFMVDVLPLLRYFPAWVPGASWQRKAKEWAEDDQNLYIELREAARVNHLMQPSFISEGLNESEYGVSEEELAYIGGTISQTPDTLMAVTSGFMLAMTRWPEIQQRAQAEIDAVVGRERFPTFSDRERLPYTVALVKEVCRWRPVAPLSVPHASTQDDEYMGYFIPKGTTIISSIWSIHRDKSVYAEPDAFNPDRFLDENGREQNTEESRVLGHHLYGFGRRLCPGATMADHAIWVFVAHALWGLKVQPFCDEQGQEIYPTVDPLSFTSGGEASHPRPFKCRIELREGVREMLDDIYEHEPDVLSD